MVLFIFYSYYHITYIFWVAQLKISIAFYHEYHFFDIWVVANGVGLLQLNFKYIPFLSVFILLKDLVYEFIYKIMLFKQFLEYSFMNEEANWYELIKPSQPLTNSKLGIIYIFYLLMLEKYEDHRLSSIHV